MNRQHDSPDKSQNAERGGTNSRAEVNDHGSKTLATIALIFGVSGATLALVLLVFLYGLWNRQTLLQIYYDDIKKELIARGMNPHPHLPSESP
jgi:hypothetical protein